MLLKLNFQFNFRTNFQLIANEHATADAKYRVPDSDTDDLFDCIVYMLYVEINRNASKGELKNIETKTKLRNKIETEKT